MKKSLVEFLQEVSPELDLTDRVLQHDLLWSFTVQQVEAELTLALSMLKHYGLLESYYKKLAKLSID